MGRHRSQEDQFLTRELSRSQKEKEEEDSADGYLQNHPGTVHRKELRHQVADATEEAAAKYRQQRRRHLPHSLGPDELDHGPADSGDPSAHCSPRTSQRTTQPQAPPPGAPISINA